MYIAFIFILEIKSYIRHLKFYFHHDFTNPFPHKSTDDKKKKHYWLSFTFMALVNFDQAQYISNFLMDN